MAYIHYTNNLVHLANTPAQAESLLHRMKQAVGGIDLYVNYNKTEYTCFKQKTGISILSDKPLKLEGQFTYLSSTSDLLKAKVWNTIDKLSII